MTWTAKIRQAKRGLQHAAVRGHRRRYSYWVGVHYRLLLRVAAGKWKS